MTSSPSVSARHLSRPAAAALTVIAAGAVFAAALTTAHLILPAKTVTYLTNLAWSAPILACAVMALIYAARLPWTRTVPAPAVNPGERPT